MIKDMHSDIAPAEGRAALDKRGNQPSPGKLTWQSDLAMGGKFSGITNKPSRTVRLKGRIYSRNRYRPRDGWIEAEIMREAHPVITDLFLVGTRPLPRADIISVCRHPFSKDLLVAVTSNYRLLLLDGRLAANLNILAEVPIPSPLISLVCCGDRLLGLEAPPAAAVQIIELAADDTLIPFILAGRITLPVHFTALAENDGYSAWGLSPDGDFYLLELYEPRLLNTSISGARGDNIRKVGCLRGRALPPRGATGQVKSIYRALRGGCFKVRDLYPARGIYHGFAYDGGSFWAFRQSEQEKRSGRLLRYTQEGSLRRSYTTWPEVSMTALNYAHNHLLILDREHQQLHQYHLSDTAQPIAGWSPHQYKHPGYLPAGTHQSGRIHDLCLLYVGAQGSSAVHRYNFDKLRPLVGYVAPDGMVQDRFMDGFLLLAQRSPLLNGRGFGSDLSGEPSRREDWLALFDEYFCDQANLQGLDNCVAEINRELGRQPAEPAKIVLAIPTADRRCTDWDNHGFSLAEASHQLEVTDWAMMELKQRWQRARFRNLELTGFYFMTEQGTWNDPLLQAFPHLCREHGVKSYAIPGIYSAWMTEFSRVGFDCIAFQSSHAFVKPIGRPWYHLLKSAGRIAREFGMGMEVEIPFDVTEPSGQQKLRDYLDFASIQGWSGAFKAYFQSFNLIKTLAESKEPACRQLYDELYQLSRRGRLEQKPPIFLYHSGIPIDWQVIRPEDDTESQYFRFSLEGQQGIIEIREISEG